MQKAAIGDEGPGIGDQRFRAPEGMKSGICHANVSHNWERKWQSLRFLEGPGKAFLSIVLKPWELMFGIEIAIREDVREGRF